MGDQLRSVDGETAREEEIKQKESIQEVSEDRGHQTSTEEQQIVQEQKQDGKLDMLIRIMTENYKKY